ncbi:MAG: biosynthetic peptidoglycan transglycosylase [Nannocystaceae bacterium]
MKIVGIGGAVVVALGVAAVATVPRWAGPFVEDAIIERVEARLGGDLEIGELSFDFDHADLRGVSFTLADGSAVIFDEVEVELEEGGVWRGALAVERVALRGGTIRGDVDDFRELADKLRTQTTAEDGGGSGRRLRMRPKSVAVEGVVVDLTWPRRGSVSGRGVLEASVDVAAKKASISVRDASVHRGERSFEARRLRTEVAGGEDGGLAFPLSLAIEGGAIPLTPEIAVADVHGDVTLADRELTELVVELAGSFSDREGSKAEAGGEGGELWSIAGKVRRDFSAGDIKLDMAAFELAKVPQVLERLPLVDSGGATVGGQVSLHFADGKADVAGELAIAGLNVDHPMLASEVVRDVGFNLGLEASVDPSASELVVRKAKIERKGVALEVDGTIRHPEVVEERRYEINASIPSVPCQELLRAIPVELVPSLVGFQLSGDFEMTAAAKIDFADLEAVSLTGKVGIDKCKVKSAPPRVSSQRLQGPFTHRAVMRDGRVVVVELHPGSGDFTPLDDISPYMVAAVMTTEDGGFWRHKGFITSQFEAALRRNLMAGKIRLGASTITMQTVKNVLLSHERTFARKLQELFLTWYIERSLPKKRIMEIYLNVIEFGPGIYGVTRAARHYFGKKPADLTPPEAAYLALMLPSPVRRHVHYCEGELSTKFKRKHERILRYMQERGRIDDATYEAWKDVGVTFDRREARSKSECNAEIKRLMEASGKQHADSGLLQGATADPDDTAPELFDAILDEAESEGYDPSEQDAPGKPAMDDYDFMNGEDG